MSSSYSRSEQWSTSIMLMATRPWLPDRLDQLHELAQRGQNWDGYQSPPISAAAIQVATRLLAIAASDSGIFYPPDLCPVSGGGVQLEWRIANKELEVEILPDGLIAYLAVLDNEMVDGTFSNPDTIQPLLVWLRGR